MGLFSNARARRQRAYTRKILVAATESAEPKRHRRQQAQLAARARRAGKSFW
jgi:hypothetical protein